STLVFRSLTNQTLTVLQSNNLSATFFITPSWAKSKKNKDLAANALQQGHNLGLAITSPESLIKKAPPPPKCNAGMCDHPVNYPKLNAYLKTATTDWKRELGRLISKPIYIAFPQTKLIDIRGGHMYPNRYNSLEVELLKRGYNPIIVGFGEDTWNHMTAALSTVSLSNFFGPPYIQSTDNGTAAFMETRKKGMVEDVGVVVEAVAYLRLNYNATVVSMSECLFQRE
ncbi:hypothetical protein BDR26DRAFT_889145, partial [Obelidium mucronatum]